MQTLWDLIDPILERIAPKPRARQRIAPTVPGVPQQAPSPPEAGLGRPPADERVKVRTGRRRANAAIDGGMQVRYDAVVAHMLDKYQVRVRKWRAGMSGVAWYVTYRDGRRVNLIESPRPKGPMSVAVFLHEIGHHAIGFDVYKPRCLEEYHAWRFALAAMEEHGLNVTDQVRYRMHMSLWYAVQKARRRGIKRIPDELAPFMEKIAKPKGEAPEQRRLLRASSRSSSQ